ncbi:hypothetical protein EX30DRAFT_371831 [Ascodesmis nigricans]|uniref:Rhodanese domain-containing protein n=1 Tax=Ascodesmis nigricans TaxID=341454 RepID=A0A4S2MW56_9PEZI|nr:hypothetical protein EX30DRAFT_371831 [Ascodesmis nigricans]
MSTQQTLPGTFPTSNQTSNLTSNQTSNQTSNSTLSTHGGPGTGLSGVQTHSLHSPTQTPATAANPTAHTLHKQSTHHHTSPNQAHALHGSGGQHTHEQPLGAHEFGTNTQPGTQPPVSSLVSEALGQQTHHIPQELSESIQAGHGGVESPNSHNANTTTASTNPAQTQQRMGGTAPTIPRSEILHQLRNPSNKGDYYLLVDIRRPPLSGGVLPGALNLPAESLPHSFATLHELVRRVPLAERDAGAEVVVVFYAWEEAEAVQVAGEFGRFLGESGERVGVRVLEGGLSGWVSAGPVYAKFVKGEGVSGQDIGGGTGLGSSHGVGSGQGLGTNHGVGSGHGLNSGQNLGTGQGIGGSHGIGSGQGIGTNHGLNNTPGLSTGHGLGPNHGLNLNQGSNIDPSLSKLHPSGLGGQNPTTTGLGGQHHTTAGGLGTQHTLHNNGLNAGLDNGTIGPHTGPHAGSTALHGAQTHHVPGQSVANQLDHHQQHHYQNQQQHPMSAGQSIGTHQPHTTTAGGGLGSVGGGLGNNTGAGTGLGHHNGGVLPPSQNQSQSHGHAQRAGAGIV